jgi:hypothetical protein
MIIRHASITRLVPECVTLMILLSLLWGCVAGPGPYPSSPPPPGPAGHAQPPSRQPIATVEALQGPSVTVGGRPAYSNMPVYENEEVRTGPGSAATILIRGGGVMELDQNTDPVFTLISQTLCVLVQMFRGHAQLDSEGRCIEAATPESQAFINSRIDIRVEGGITTWRVLTGRIEVAARMKPRERVLVANEQRTTVSRTALQRPVKMTPPEVQELNRNFLRLRGSARLPAHPKSEQPEPSPPVRTGPPPPPLSVPAQPKSEWPEVPPPLRTAPPSPPASTPVQPRTQPPAILTPVPVQPRTTTVPPPR